MRPRPMLPSSIDVTQADVVTVTWRDGRVDRHQARILRLACPCAHCVHEITGQRLIDPTSIREDLRALAARPVGNYATQFAWSDGHGTGFYTHELLRKLGDKQASA